MFTYWEITDALACGMVDGVGERGSDADEANLANTFGTHGIQRVSFTNEDDIHVGYISIHGCQINTEGGICDATPL